MLKAVQRIQKLIIPQSFNLLNVIQKNRCLKTSIKIVVYAFHFLIHIKHDVFLQYHQ